MQLQSNTMHFEESAGALAQVWPQTASAERQGVEQQNHATTTYAHLGVCFRWYTVFKKVLAG
jgi:hypothetical protein